MQPVHRKPLWLCVCELRSMFYNVDPLVLFQRSSTNVFLPAFFCLFSTHQPNFCEERVPANVQRHNCARWLWVFLPYNHQRQQQQQQQHNTGNNNSNSSHSSNTGNSNSRVEVHFFEVPCIASLLPFFEILLMNIFLTLRCAAFIIIVGDVDVDVVVVVVVEVVDVVVVVEVVGKK